MANYDFNPPPGWPTPPPGWRPVPGWQPDPSWPAPPVGWNFWVVRPPSKARRIALAVLGIASALTLVIVAGVVVVQSNFSDRGIPVPAGAPVPSFSSVQEATDYYEQQKADLRAYVDANPFGYDYTFVDGFIADFDAKVSDERGDLSPDPAVIAAAGYQLVTLREGFEGLVAAWEAEYAPKPALLDNVSGTVAEAALDAVSLGVSDISFDDFCGTTDEALACVASGTTVHVPLEIQGYDDERMRAEFGDHWASIMWHEFGHVIQNKYYLRLVDDPDFIRLFENAEKPADADDYDYPIEHLADCMAASVLSDYVMGYPGECTAEKLDFGRSVWDGSFYTG